MSSRSPRYDWEAIELDYKAGVLPLEGIHSKHGVSVIRLLTVAKERGWERLPPPDAATVHGMASSGYHPTAARAESFNTDTLKTAALVTASGVIVQHRNDVNKLRANTALLVERLGLLLQGAEVTLPCLGGRESPADLLEKLSRVMVRTVQLERQSFGLDAMGQNPGGDAPDADAVIKQVHDELADLRASLDTINDAKAKEAAK